MQYHVVMGHVVFYVIHSLFTMQYHVVDRVVFYVIHYFFYYVIHHAVPRGGGSRSFLRDTLSSTV